MRHCRELLSSCGCVENCAALAHSGLQGMPVQGNPMPGSKGIRRGVGPTSTFSPAASSWRTRLDEHGAVRLSARDLKICDGTAASGKQLNCTSANTCGHGNKAQVHGGQRRQSSGCLMQRQQQSLISHSALRPYWAMHRRVLCNWHAACTQAQRAQHTQRNSRWSCPPRTSCTPGTRAASTASLWVRMWVNATTKSTPCKGSQALGQRVCGWEMGG